MNPSDMAKAREIVKNVLWLTDEHEELAEEFILAIAAALAKVRAEAYEEAAKVADAKAKLIGLQFGCGQKDRHGNHYHDDRCETFGEEIRKLGEGKGGNDARN